MNNYLFIIDLPSSTMNVYHNEHGIYYMERIPPNEMAVAHRIGGPAVINRDGTEEYYERGVRHRANGPAVVYTDGRPPEYWVNGRRTR